MPIRIHSANEIDRTPIVTFREIEDSLSCASTALWMGRLNGEDPGPLWTAIDELLTLHALMVRLHAYHRVCV